jgi:hypothetical protein
VKIHTGFEQGSLQWLMARAGVVTASELDALISPFGAIRKGDGVWTYLTKKLAEKWSGAPLPSGSTFDMEQGQILEEKAKPAFTIETGIAIENVAFITSDDGLFGCSPDSIIGNESGVEIKCPRLETHVGYLLDGVLPPQYVAQIQGSMFVTGFKTWHFFSYRRKIPPLHLVIERDEKYQASLKSALEGFKAQFDKAWNKLVEINGGEPARLNQPTPSPAPEQNWDLPTL